MIMLYAHRYNKFYGLSDEGQILVVDDKEIQHSGFIDICNYIEKYGEHTPAGDMRRLIDMCNTEYRPREYRIRSR